MVIKKITSAECLKLHYQVLYLLLCCIANYGKSTSHSLTVKCKSNAQGTISKKKNSEYKVTLEAIKMISQFVNKTSISIQNYIQYNIQTFKGFT